jgi:hypothetical protein
VQRLIEQPIGEGDVLEGGTHVGRVQYHLSVYQHFSEVEGEPVPAAIVVEGRIEPRNDFDRSRFSHGRAELTLHLADGRLLDFLIVDEGSSIRSTGRALYQP